MEEKSEVDRDEGVIDRGPSPTMSQVGSLTGTLTHSTPLHLPPQKDEEVGGRDEGQPKCGEEIYR